ncbi:hypothetical protein PF007_g6138 [Phytophthora fragariae]|uniref:Uncharacterized protein n=1 Tax=Phytophthora fragariae TaxID=53985 RepID=A0A6A3T8K8_9STRA|nr:hypothetical protein PF009_g6436 [Phytophthora fragariae]KAE9126012.1 hypothetical protein PF007_g6138 [Phytophthora fragariae]KAE9131330.1 hypothetical protein PF006_g15561 [Phytophthora fragariae]KAE9300800.1 hypothetical protein PF001_g14766 [Phytophthora fragariae]
MQAEPGRARTGSDEGVESTAVARARGDGNTGNVASATTEGGEASELLALLRGVAGRLDKLEESQTKLEQRLEPPKKDAKALMNTSLFASALGRGSRMHIDSLSGTPHTQTPRRPTAPPQYFGLRHADVGSHEPDYGMSELQRLYAAEHAAQAGQRAQPPPGQRRRQHLGSLKLSRQPFPRSTSTCSRTRAGRSDTRTLARRSWRSARSTARSCTSGWAPASWTGAGDSSGKWRSGSRRAVSHGSRT